jgi:hypothetical protein
MVVDRPLQNWGKLKMKNERWALSRAIIGCLLFAACSMDDGSIFAGNWEASNNTGNTLVITKSGNTFVLKFNERRPSGLGHSGIGTYRDGILVVSWGGCAVPFHN